MTDSERVLGLARLTIFFLALPGIKETTFIHRGPVGLRRNGFLLVFKRQNASVRSV